MSKTEDNPKSNNTLTLDLIYDSSLWQAEELDVFSIVNNASQVTIEELGLLDLGKKIEIGILLSDDPKLQDLNKEYRNKDRPTNVLSFPNFELSRSNYLDLLRHEKEVYLGDIALSYSTIYNESIEQDKSFGAHLSHMIIHSILHLVGYDHELDSEAEIMEALEVKILSKLNISNPYYER